MEEKENVEQQSLKENKIWIGEDEIIYVDIVKAGSEEDIMNMLDELKRFVEKLPNKARILLNLATDSIIKSSQFRKRAGVKFREINRLTQKSALYGGNIITRTISSFIINTIGLEDIKVFENKEKALKWLKE